MPAIHNTSFFGLNYDMLCLDCDAEFGSDELKRTYRNGELKLVVKCPCCESKNVEFVMFLKENNHAELPT